jgi:hypothetical protein
MSSFKPSRHLVMAGLILAMAGALAGCTSFRPVYSGTLAAQPVLNLSYAKPNSRLEQVIYQELALRLGESSAPGSPVASVSVSSSAGGMALSDSVNPSIPLEVTVTATLTITPTDGTEALRFVRRATANYTRNGQVLADRAAANEAAERAAKAAAESLRLAVLADLSR